jgi:hypothetical protein
MPAAKHDVEIEQGSVFTLDLIYKDGDGVPIDLTGYRARMQMRQKFASPDPPLLDLTTENGAITLGGATGEIHVEAISELTAAIKVKRGVYDLELIPPSGEDYAFRLIAGEVIVSPEVTRP